MNDSIMEYFHAQELAEKRRKELLEHKDESIETGNDLDLLCNAQICVNKKGEIVVDLRKTTCDAKNAKKILEKLSNKLNKAQWKMPSIKE